MKDKICPSQKIQYFSVSKSSKKIEKHLNLKNLPEQIPQLTCNVDKKMSQE